MSPVLAGRFFATEPSGKPPTPFETTRWLEEALTLGISPFSLPGTQTRDCPSPHGGPIPGGAGRRGGYHNWGQFSGHCPLKARGHLCLHIWLASWAVQGKALFSPCLRSSPCEHGQIKTQQKLLRRHLEATCSVRTCPLPVLVIIFTCLAETAVQGTHVLTCQCVQRSSKERHLVAEN